jgi:hypothetical protein
MTVIPEDTPTELVDFTSVASLPEPQKDFVVNYEAL